MTNVKMIKDLSLRGGVTVLEASKAEKLLFVFVRHRGCTFCREALTGLSKHKERLQALGYRLIVVQMGSEESSELMKKDFDLHDVEFISDPERIFYKAFGARRANLIEAIGPKVVLKGLFGGKLKKYGVGKMEGDGFQLGGVFTVVGEKVEFIHNPKDASDVEDWDKLIEADAV